MGTAEVEQFLTHLAVDGHVWDGWHGPEVLQRACPASEGRPSFANTYQPVTDKVRKRSPQ
jgi:hypothetical protein